MKLLLPCGSGFSDQAISARLGRKEERRDRHTFKINPVEELDLQLQKACTPPIWPRVPPYTTVPLLLWLRAEMLPRVTESPSAGGPWCSHSMLALKRGTGVELGGWAGLTLHGTSALSDSDSKRPFCPCLPAPRTAPEKRSSAHAEVHGALLRDGKTRGPQQEPRVWAEGSLRMGARHSFVPAFTRSLALNQPTFQNSLLNMPDG